MNTPKWCPANAHTGVVTTLLVVGVAVLTVLALYICYPGYTHPANYLECRQVQRELDEIEVLLASGRRQPSGWQMRNGVAVYLNSDVKVGCVVVGDSTVDCYVNGDRLGLCLD